MDSTDALAYALLGEIYMELSDFDLGLVAFEHALALNSNDPDILVLYGGWLYVFGRAKEGVELLDRAFRLNPRLPTWYNNFPDAYYAIGQYEQTVAMVLRGSGSIWPDIVLALSYAQLGRKTDVAAVVFKLSQSYPDLSMERAFSDFGGIRDQPTQEHYLDGARKAGLRECASDADLQKFPKMTHLAVCDAKRAVN